MARSLDNMFLLYNPLCIVSADCMTVLPILHGTV